jgi:hypothetical protein
MNRIFTNLSIAVIMRPDNLGWFPQHSSDVVPELFQDIAFHLAAQYPGTMVLKELVYGYSSPKI